MLCGTHSKTLLWTNIPAFSASPLLNTECICEAFYWNLEVEIHLSTRHKISNSNCKWVNLVYPYICRSSWDYYGDWFSCVLFLNHLDDQLFLPSVYLTTLYVQSKKYYPKEFLLVRNLKILTIWFLLQRLSTSVTMVTKGVLKDHLVLLANSMTCAGNLVGFNAGGIKALSRSLNVQIPFTEATLFVSHINFLLFCTTLHFDNSSCELFFLIRVLFVYLFFYLS